MSLTPASFDCRMNRETSAAEALSRRVRFRPPLAAPAAEEALDVLKAVLLWRC